MKSFVIKHWFFILFWVALPNMIMIAQTDIVAYYSFDNCDAFDDSERGSDGQLFGSPGCDCGVSGMALEFDGVDDYVVFFSTINTYFDDDDFTLSFYFKSYSNVSQRSLISKKSACSNEANIDIRLSSNQNQLFTELNLTNTDRAVNTVNIAQDACWQHVVLTRRNAIFSTYINGVQQAQSASSSILDLDNNALLSIGNSPCIGVDGTQRFHGLIDELTVYKRSLNSGEVAGLYLKPDQLVTQDTLIFLGDAFQVYNTSTCATLFNWTPDVGVSDYTIPNPVLSPDSTTTYFVDFIDDRGCAASDSIQVTVIDPSLLGCESIFIPTAFTPNDDGLNDEFRVSNPQSISEVISFDIYDRWGTRVFSSPDRFASWDGKLNGRALKPGIFVYQLRYRCEGQELVKSGTFTLIK